MTSTTNDARTSMMAIPESTASNRFFQRLLCRVVESRRGFRAAKFLGIVMLAAWVLADLAPGTQVVLSLLVVGIAMILASKAPEKRLVIVFLSVGVTLRYIYYRATQTLVLEPSWDMVASLALFAAELYSLTTMLAGYFQNAIIRRRTPPPIDPESDDLPLVDVYIPTYNESLDVLLPTVIGALAMEYPRKSVWVLDDGRRPEVRDAVEALGANYITRPDNRGAKAGNVNHALPLTKGGLIAFFDADHVPVRGFLKATVGFFLENPRLALVQVPHHFYNSDPFLRNLYLEGSVPPEQHLFYHSVQLGNDFWNSAFFCGSCALIKREALEGIGGMAQDTVTEDAHTALRMHADGWDSAFLDVPLAAGLATEGFAAHIGQRMRWARGMAQIFRLDNPLLKRGLSIPQRINYFNASWHFFAGLPRIIFFIIPPLFLLFGVHPVIADVWEVLLYAVPHLFLVGITSALVHRNVRHSIWAEVFEVAIAPYTALVTTLAFFAPGHGRFNVTAKGTLREGLFFDVKHAAPLLVLLAFVLASVLVAPWEILQRPLDRDVVAVVAIWNLYNLVILLAAIAAALERPQRRTAYRLQRRLGLIVGPTGFHGGKVAPFKPFEASSKDISMSGVAFTVDSARDVPERFSVRIQSPTGTSPPLGVELIARETVGESVLVRCRFKGLSEDQRRILTEFLFSPSNAWIGDRFGFDSFIGSFASVLMAPVVAILGNPPWLRKLVERPGTGRGAAPLVPGMGTRRCPVCGEILLEGATSCESCHMPLSNAAPGLPAALPRVRPRPGIRPLVLPLSLIALALAMALGWSPVVQAVSPYIPAAGIQLDRPTYRTRLADLARAYDEIHELLSSFKTASMLGVDLPESWSGKLWGIRRDYALYGDSSLRPECAEIEAKLYSAMLSLATLEDEYRADADSRVIQQRIRSLEADLHDAAVALGIPE